MNKACEAGNLLANGKSPEEVAQELEVSEAELLELTDRQELTSAFRQRLRLKQMAGYGLALHKLTGQLSSENEATVLKAAHEMLSLKDSGGEEPLIIREKVIKKR